MREDWVKCKLKEASVSFAGGTPSRAVSAYFDGGIPWVSSGEVNAPLIEETKETISELGLVNSSAKWIPSGAVLIAMYGATAGQVSKLLIRATSNQAVLALVANRDVLNSDLLYYLLKFRKDSIIYLAQGSGQPNLSKELIENLTLTIPKSLETQQKIACILSTLDGVIARTEGVIAKYTALKAGLLQDLFTRGIDASGQLRPSPQEDPDLYEESALGLIPKEWKVEKLVTMCSLITDGSHFSPVPQADGELIVNVKDMGEYKINYESCTRITPKAFKLLKSQNCSPQPGDVLLSKDGTIGKSLLYGTEREVVLLSSIAIIRPQQEKLESSFLYSFFRTDYLTRQLKKFESGSALKRMVLRDINSVMVTVPQSTEEQKMISEKFLPVETNIRTEQTYLTKLKGIRAGLMADLLSGNVDVSTIAIPTSATTTSATATQEDPALTPA